MTIFAQKGIAQAVADRLTKAKGVKYVLVERSSGWEPVSEIELAVDKELQAEASQTIAALAEIEQKTPPLVKPAFPGGKPKPVQKYTAKPQQMKPWKTVDDFQNEGVDDLKIANLKPKGPLVAGLKKAVEPDVPVFIGVPMFHETPQYLGVKPSENKVRWLTKSKLLSYVIWKFDDKAPAILYAKTMSSYVKKGKLEGMIVNTLPLGLETQLNKVSAV